MVDNSQAINDNQLADNSNVMTVLISVNKQASANNLAVNNSFGNQIDMQNNQVINHVNNQKTLPQTGNEDNLLAVLGLDLSAMALGLMALDKKH